MVHFTAISAAQTKVHEGVKPKDHRDLDFENVFEYDLVRKGVPVFRSSSLN
jgi:hypothetical protein